MKTDSKFCDVCGCEIDRSAYIYTNVGHFKPEFSENNKQHPYSSPEIRITLNKLGGAYAEFCAECAREALVNAVIINGIKGQAKLVTK